VRSTPLKVRTLVKTDNFRQKAVKNPVLIGIALRVDELSHRSRNVKFKEPESHGTTLSELLLST
jgi:hypothetical protein